MNEKLATLPLFVLLLTFSSTDTFFQIHLFMSTIDTSYYPSQITPEGMETFQFTNAYYIIRYVAVYSQQGDGETMINFTGITAGISLHVYLVTAR